MTLVRLREVQPCEIRSPLDSPPIKRRRCSPVQSPTKSTSSAISLDTLPPELLAIILDFSHEASLIHTSRRLWCNLPAYVAYTRSLALKALVQLEDWPDLPKTTLEPGLDIASLHGCLDSETHRHLRQAVFSSGWFGERHLNKTHRALLHWTILQCCSWYGDNAPSKYQRQRIKSFVERQSAPSSSAVLYLRIPSGGRRIRYLSAKQLCVTISGAPFFRPLSFQVLDFGGIVPDHLLRVPVTASKVTVLRDMCKSIWIARDEQSLICNRMLLHEAILQCITFHDMEKFHVLMSLEGRSRKAGTADDVVLDLDLIRRAVVHGRPGMLIRVLKQMWTSPHMATVSDLELVNIMNEAGAQKYPDFQNTTRVLAMEVAAKWKMSEIEQAGQSAHRVPMDWPPRLIYPTVGSAESQVWFIPRDSHHDVDWEASLEVPGLPLCTAPFRDSPYFFQSQTGC